MVLRLPYRVGSKIDTGGAGGPMPPHLITPRFLAGKRYSRIEDLAGGAAAVVEAEFREVVGVQVSGQNSHTFSAVDFGAADAGRKIIAACYNSSGLPGTIAAVTLGGVSASEIVAVASSTNNQLGLWQADVPTGTTGDVFIDQTADGQGEIYGAAIWRVIGAAAAADDTLTSTANPMTGTINCPAGGVIIGAGTDFTTSATYTWAGITEVYDTTALGNDSWSGASDVFIAAQTNLTITCTQSVDTQNGMAVCSFGPA
jgi:hypothetical protein